VCGIGIVAQGDDDRRAAVLRSMLDVQRHRGPDSETLMMREGAGFAHSRLAIIDLSASAAQPMSNADGTLWLLFNGEIYNYRELRAELAAYPFRTQSDTEVLLAAYERWGEACLDRLIGMFAFAVWDDRAGSLFAARDRFGVKPLYYGTAPDGAVVLASEINALHAAGIPREPDAAAWATYFAYGMYDGGEATFWRGVRRVPAGYALRWSPEEGIQHSRWYDVAARVREGGEDEREERVVEDELFALLTNTVELRFRSDVPVGLCLSGGLDSSLLLGLVSRTHPHADSVQAFTFYCEDPRYDERRWIEPLIAAAPRPWHAAALRECDVPALASAVQRNQDEPWGGFPTLGMAAVHASARDHGVTVLLDGNGLDEGWGGYEYYADAAAQDLRRGPVQGASNDASVTWLQPGFARLAVAPDVPAAFSDPLRNVQYRDLIYAKIPRAMRFSDRVSMMFSRELREPFLDHRIVELGLRQPANRKLRNGQGKWLVRELARRAKLIDEHVLSAPKRAVQTPQREWLRGPLASWADEHIGAALAGWGRDWLDADAVWREWRRYTQRGADSSFHVWQWISLGLAEATQPANAELLPTPVPGR
jgi:asparagine synthase (glutamine-hydrolysing)